MYSNSEKMRNEKPITDILFEKFQKSLPKQLQPHAIKFPIILFLVGLFILLGFGFRHLLAMLLFLAILCGVIFVWASVRRMIDKIKDKNV